MATVTFNRGGNTKLNNTANTDGMVYFNSDDKCIYVDNGTTREVYGGKTPFATNTTDASASNVYSASTTNNLFCLKSNVADTSSAIISNKNNNSVPVGCKGFVSTIGEDDDYNYENRTTVKGYIGNLKNRLKVDDNEFVFGYHNNQWGFYTSETRGADTFHPFNSTQATMSSVWKGGSRSCGYGFLNNIEYNSVNIIYKATTSAAETALKTDLVAGTLASYIAYEYNTIDALESEYTIHVFYDQYGKASAGNHKHSIYTQESKAWHELSDTTNESPLAFVSGAVNGQPFIMTHKEQWTYGSEPEDYVVSDLYFVVGTSNQIQIYQWNPSSTNLWSGSWSNSPISTYTLPDGRTYTEIGGYHSIIVYNNELHIFGGVYNNGTIDTNHYVWNPNNGWKTDVTVPNDLLLGTTNYAGMSGCVVHNKKIYCFGTSGLIYTFDGSTWTNILTTSYDYKGASFVEYNGQIHILGGDNSNSKVHAFLNEEDTDPYISTSMYAALSIPFKNGCICTLPANGMNQDSQLNAPYFFNIDSSAKAIHYMGTTNANPSNGNYRKKHYSLIDTYNVDIRNKE
jgi:hypothetical protein